MREKVAPRRAVRKAILRSPATARLKHASAATPWMEATVGIGQGPDAGHDALSLPNKGLRVLFSQVLHDSQVPATAESLPGPREYEDA
jgi:hypothetical protein